MQLFEAMIKKRRLKIFRMAVPAGLFCALTGAAFAAPMTESPLTEQSADMGVPVSTQTAVGLVNRANKLYNRGQFSKAIILYRKAKGRGADLGTVSFNIGNCLYRLSRLPEAAAAFKKTERLTEGKYAPAIFNLAAVLFRLEQYGECIAAYRRALRLDPENGGAWLYLADAYSRSRDYVGTLQALEKARALEPDDFSIVYQMAETHAAMKEYPAAIALVREAYERKPSEVDFLFYIGDLYRAQGMLEPAAAAYQEGLVFREKDHEAMYKLADVLAQDKKVFLAMEYLQAAIDLKPDYTDASVFLGILAFDAKWWDRAGSAYLQALKFGNKEGLEGLRNLAFEYHRQGHHQRAAEILNAALAYRPKDKALRAEMEEYQALQKSTGM